MADYIPPPDETPGYIPPPDEAEGASTPQQFISSNDLGVGTTRTPQPANKLKDFFQKRREVLEGYTPLGPGGYGTMAYRAVTGEVPPAFIPEPTVEGAVKGLSNLVLGPARAKAYLGKKLGDVTGIDFLKEKYGQEFDTLGQGARSVSEATRQYEGSPVRSVTGQMIGESVPFLAMPGAAPGIIRGGIEGSLLSMGLNPQETAVAPEDYAAQQKEAGKLGLLLGSGAGAAVRAANPLQRLLRGGKSRNNAATLAEDLAARLEGREAPDVIQSNLATRYAKDKADARQPFEELRARDTQGLPTGDRRVDPTRAATGDRRSNVATRQRVQEIFDRFGTMSPEERISAVSEVNRMVHTDELTGLGNKRAWSEALAEAEAKGDSIASIDVKGLKWINDNHGHQYGDELLKRIGEAFQETGHPQGFYRTGGDEFYTHGNEEQIQAAIARAKTYLSENPIIVQAGDSRIVVEPRFAYGTGKSIPEAEAALHADQAALRASGADAGRGAKPGGVSEVPSGSTSAAPKRGIELPSYQKALAEVEQDILKSGGRVDRQALSEIKGYAKGYGEAESKGWNRALNISRQLNSDISKANAAGDKNKVRLLEKAKKALEADLAQFDEYKQAKALYKEKMAPWETKEEGSTFLKRAMESPTPDLIAKEISRSSPDKARIYYDRLSVQGRDAVKSAMLDEVLLKAEGNPLEIAKALKESKRSGAWGVFFEGDDLKRLNGFEKLMKYAHRTGATFSTATGAATAAGAGLAHPLIGAYVGRKMLTGPSAKGFASIYKTDAMQRLLLDADKLSDNSPELAKLLEKLPRLMATGVEPEDKLKKLLKKGQNR